MIPIHVESAWKGTSDCHACGIRDLVLFADLNEDDFSLIHEPIDDMAFPVGRVIYSEGEKAIGVLNSESFRYIQATTNKLSDSLSFRV